MTRPLALVGGGGFGREILDIIDALNAGESEDARIDVIGVWDDGKPDIGLLNAYEVHHLGQVSDVLGLPAEVAVTVGVANPQTRRRIVSALGDRRRPALVHPTATMGRKVQLGQGVVVSSHVSIANHVVIDDDVHIGANSTIGHDCTLRSCVTVSPLVALSGNVLLGDGAFLGTGSSLNQGVIVGRDSVVGSGATVIRDVEPDTVVVGTPARTRP
jgi:sugar O-acyltransferase (sialic acid O-acetyltransferase NeuD family)